MIPAKIRIISDRNELELQPNATNKVKSNQHIYKYTKSITKLGQLLAYTEFEIDKLIENKLIEIL